MVQNGVINKVSQVSKNLQIVKGVGGEVQSSAVKLMD